MKRFSLLKRYLLSVSAIIVIGAFWFAGISFARQFALNFLSSARELILFLPLMFLLIGLFDTWVSRETVMRHIGKGSGLKGMALVVLLATLQAGPLYGAFPVAYMLWKKGSSSANMFIYLGAFSTLKIPMVAFEIGFLGLKFSLLRLAFTLPVFVCVGLLMGRLFPAESLRLQKPDE